MQGFPSPSTNALLKRLAAKLSQPDGPWEKWQRYIAQTPALASQQDADESDTDFADRSKAIALCHLLGRAKSCLTMELLEDWVRKDFINDEALWWDLINDINNNVDAVEPLFSVFAQTEGLGPEIQEHVFGAIPHSFMFRKVSQEQLKRTFREDFNEEMETYASLEASLSVLKSSLCTNQTSIWTSIYPNIPLPAGIDPKDKIAVMEAVFNKMKQEEGITRTRSVPTPPTEERPIRHGIRRTQSVPLPTPAVAGMPIGETSDASGDEDDFRRPDSTSASAGGGGSRPSRTVSFVSPPVTGRPPTRRRGNTWRSVVTSKDVERWIKNILGDGYGVADRYKLNDEDFRILLSGIPGTGNRGLFQLVHKLRRSTAEYIVTLVCYVLRAVLKTSAMGMLGRTDFLSSFLPRAATERNPVTTSFLTSNMLIQIQGLLDRENDNVTADQLKRALHTRQHQIRLENWVSFSCKKARTLDTSLKENLDKLKTAIEKALNDRALHAVPIDGSTIASTIDAALRPAVSDGVAAVERDGLSSTNAHLQAMLQNALVVVNEVAENEPTVAAMQHIDEVRRGAAEAWRMLKANDDAATTCRTSDDAEDAAKRMDDLLHQTQRMCAEWNRQQINGNPVDGPIFTQLQLDLSRVQNDLKEIVAAQRTLKEQVMVTVQRVSDETEKEISPTEVERLNRQLKLVEEKINKWKPVNNFITRFGTHAMKIGAILGATYLFVDELQWTRVLRTTIPPTAGRVVGYWAVMTALGDVVDKYLPYLTWVMTVARTIRRLAFWLAKKFGLKRGSEEVAVVDDAVEASQLVSEWFMNVYTFSGTVRAVLGTMARTLLYSVRVVPATFMLTAFGERLLTTAWSHHQGWHMINGPQALVTLANMYYLTIPIAQGASLMCTGMIIYRIYSCLRDSETLQNLLDNTLGNSPAFDHWILGAIRQLFRAVSHTCSYVGALVGRAYGINWDIAIDEGPETGIFVYPPNVSTSGWINEDDWICTHDPLPPTDEIGEGCNPYVEANHTCTGVIPRSLRLGGVTRDFGTRRLPGPYVWSPGTTNLDPRSGRLTPGSAFECVQLRDRPNPFGLYGNPPWAIMPNVKEIMALLMLEFESWDQLQPVGGSSTLHKREYWEQISLFWEKYASARTDSWACAASRWGCFPLDATNHPGWWAEGGGFGASMKWWACTGLVDWAEIGEEVAQGREWCEASSSWGGTPLSFVGGFLRASFQFLLDFSGYSLFTLAEQYPFSCSAGLACLLWFIFRYKPPTQRDPHTGRDFVPNKLLYFIQMVVEAIVAFIRGTARLVRRGGGGGHGSAQLCDAGASIDDICAGMGSLYTDEGKLRVWEVARESVVDGIVQGRAAVAAAGGVGPKKQIEMPLLF